MKLATAGKAFGYWNKKDNTFQFKLPPGTCKAEMSFMGVSCIHEVYFSKNTSEASHVSWEDYDYDYKSEAYMLDREFTKCGRPPTIVERPIPRVENMSEFYNPTRPSHFINGSLVRKRRVHAPPHELRPARRIGGTMGMNQGPAYFTRSRSSPAKRPRSYSKSPSKTPDRRRSYLKSPTRSLVWCPSIRSCTRSGSASYTRSRSRSPSYSGSSPRHDAYSPAWKRQFAQVPRYQKDFLKNVISHLKGMPNPDSLKDVRFLNMFGEMLRKTAKLNLLKWLTTQLLSKSMVERHPQMYPSFHDIQLDLPDNDQAASSSDSPAPPNITVEYAEKQISKRERNFFQYLSTLIYKSEFVDKLAFATSMHAATLLTIQAIYHDPKRAEWTTQEYIADNILVTWYASVSHTQTDKLCKLRDVYSGMGYGKDFEMFGADSKFDLPKMRKGGNKKQTPAMGVAVLS